MIHTLTTRNFYLRFKENNENVMAVQVFWAVFIPADSPAELAQQLISTMLPFPRFSTAPTVLSSSELLLLEIMQVRGNQFLSLSWQIV